MNYNIRKAKPEDEQTVVSIYNYFIENSFAAYSNEKVGTEIFDKYFSESITFMILEVENKVVGFAYLQFYLRFSNFNKSALVTYFILPENTKKGFGTKILDKLEEIAKSNNIDNLIANISSGNKQSLNFHKKRGFIECGRFKKMGNKFGQDIDIIWVQKFLNDTKLNLEIKKISTDSEAKLCAKLMSESEPWITLKRNYQKSLDLFNNSSKECYIAYYEKQFAGFILLDMKGAFAGYIQSVAVIPGLRNQGIGRKLLKLAEKRIFRELSNVFVCVSSFNPEAKKMYLKLGYEIIGELKDFIINGHSEILMRKQIEIAKE